MLSKNCETDTYEKVEQDCRWNVVIKWQSK